jgi:glycosyltransferase involved in cell wall biosynthesis
MKEEIAHSFLGDKPCRVIPNGIDLDVFKPSPGGPAGCYYLAVASIWLPEKGLEDLSALAALLDSDERLVVVGRLPEGYRFPDGVDTLERTADAQALARLYTGAAALVNPTWQDNYPTVNLESLACGTPVVTYRTGGSVESVTPDTGAVVEQGDVKGLLEALHTIRAQGKERYSDRCRRYALSHFSKDDCFRKYISLYESLTTG